MNSATTTTRRPIAAAVALLAATAALSPLALAAPPAGAQVQVIHDPAGDRRPQGEVGDIVTVRLTHGPHAFRAKVVHRPNGDRTVEDITLAWIDTDPRDPGPEYQVVAGLEVRSIGVKRVDDWGRLSGTEVECDRATVDFGRGDEPLRMRVPRVCLGDPERLRASIATEPDYPFRRVDWAPGVKTFGRWLVRGPVARPQDG